MRNSVVKSRNSALPTTAEIRAAVAVIHVGVHDPDADPIGVAAAHQLLIDAHAVAEPPVSHWLAAYLDRDATAHGAKAFTDVVDRLARNFKLPPIGRVPAPGEQGTLFD